MRPAPGGNAPRAAARIGTATVADAIRWTAPDAAAGLAIDSGTLTGHVAADGRRCGSDGFFEGGSTSSPTPMLPGGRTAPGRAVSGTADPRLFDTYRSGSFR